MGEKELKTLMSFVKKVHSRPILKKIRSISDKGDKKEALKYSIRTKLDIDYYNLTKKIKKLKEEKNDVFSLEIKARMLGLKIKLFEATSHKKDFNMVMSLFNEIKKEMKNV